MVAKVCLREKRRAFSELFLIKYSVYDFYVHNSVDFIVCDEQFWVKCLTEFLYTSGCEFEKRLRCEFEGFPLNNQVTRGFIRLKAFREGHAIRINQKRLLSVL